MKNEQKLENFKFYKISKNKSSCQLEPFIWSIVYKTFNFVISETSRP